MGVITHEVIQQNIVSYSKINLSVLKLCSCLFIYEKNQITTVLAPFLPSRRNCFLKKT